MKAVIDRVAGVVPIDLEVIDISADADLERQYGTDIPVLFVEDRKIAKYRIAEEALRRILQGTGGGRTG
jgi:hypothetical protein